MLELERLEENFKKNLEFFEKYIPRLAAKFKDYRPEADLVTDTKGGINIYDRRKETYLYPSDGRLITYKQLAEWMQNPKIFTLANQHLEGAAEWIHIKYINRLVDLKREILKTNALALSGKLPLLWVVGVGLGEHLKFLVENFEIEDLLISEPNEDFFYISLHTLDWEAILKPFFDSEGLKGLKILVGEEAKDRDNVVSFFRIAGPFKISTSYIYIHYLDSFLRQFIAKVGTEAASEVSFFGFFDDEIISLKHTLANIKNKVQIFLPKTDFKPKNAAAVVGSGPSLERLLPYLKKYRDKLFVISCGTALAVLEKNGIVPDLHVNVERNEPPYEVAVKTTSEEFRKKVKFLGANNNYPPFFEVFGKNAVYLKAGDSGASLFPFEPLYYVNPTVTNAGLSLSYYLGFDRVYLFGVDLAFPEQKHHARGSAYDTLLKDVNLKGEIEVEANFGGKVGTSSLFYSSLRIMEESIDYFKTQRHGFVVFNPNFGAKIEGTRPLALEELETALEGETYDDDFKKHYWEKTVGEIKTEWFDFPRVKMQLMTNFFQLKAVMENDLLSLKDFEDYAKAIKDFYNYLRVIREHNFILFSLLHGTLTLFLAHTYTGLYANTDAETRRAFLEKSKELLREMLNEMEKEIYNLYSHFPS